MSLAHRSILFLDELPEFNRTVLEALREPLETGHVEIARVNQQVTYPARVQLVCAMNPTPSGFFPMMHWDAVPTRQSKSVVIARRFPGLCWTALIAISIDVQLRTSEHRSMYSYVRQKISGPLLDRIDCHFDRCTATYV